MTDVVSGLRRGPCCVLWQLITQALKAPRAALCAAIFVSPPARIDVPRAAGCEAAQPELSGACRASALRSAVVSLWCCFDLGAACYPWRAPALARAGARDGCAQRLCYTFVFRSYCCFSTSTVAWGLSPVVLDRACACASGGALARSRLCPPVFKSLQVQRGSAYGVQAARAAACGRLGVRAQPGMLSHLSAGC